MHYQPRTIAFLCDLLHPPQPPDPRPIQALHNELFEAGQPTYSSFAVSAHGPVLSNPGTQPNAVSQVAFLSDRIRFREEFGGLTCELFADRVRAILERMMVLRPVQIFSTQQVTVRSLINPRSFKDSRAFLRDGMFRFSEEQEAFGRNPQLYGLRLVFPPGGNDSDAFSLRIESYQGDQRSLYIENQGSFPPLVLTNNLEIIHDRITTTYRFLLEHALPFISRFDVPADK